MTAAEVSADLLLAEQSRALLREGMTPLDFVDALSANQQYADAVTVLAHVMPSRERVWWACYCARQCPDFAGETAVEAAVQAAEAWVTDGSEASRYQAFEAAQAVRLGSAANCAAMAAFASAGSMAPPDADPVAPPPRLSAQLTAGSVVVASLAEGAENAVRRYAFFLDQGTQLYRAVLQSAA